MAGPAPGRDICTQTPTRSVIAEHCRAVRARFIGSHFGKPKCESFEERLPIWPLMVLYRTSGKERHHKTITNMIVTKRSAYTVEATARSRLIPDAHYLLRRAEITTTIEENTMTQSSVQDLIRLYVLGCKIYGKDANASSTHLFSRHPTQ